MTTSSPASQKRRVLLVDDDAISMEVLALLLDHDGHEVLRANDGETALDLLHALHREDLPRDAGSAASPDVLLVDLQMPGVSGYEVAKRVRAMGGRKPLLLAMSATKIESAKLDGFDGFLLKPLALGDLRRALETKKPGREPGTGGDRARRPMAAVNHTVTIDQIDLGVLRKLESAMPASALRELYEACIADTRARAMALRSQVLAGDLSGVSRCGHQIKGAASMVGAAHIAKLALSLELGSCKEEDILQLLDNLLSSCSELERILLAGK
jgi:CheY-like chemotaxis protein